MNDTPTAATQADKEAAVEKGMRLFERTEESLEKIAALWTRGLEAGMMSKNEHDHLVNDTQALWHMVRSLHCRGTAIAQRNNCDVITTQGGPGR